MSVAALLAEVPALPLHTAGKYVAGAYIVLFALVLIYVAIMAVRLNHIERELGELVSVAETSAQTAAQREATAGRAAGEEGAPAYPMKGHT